MAVYILQVSIIEDSLITFHGLAVTLLFCAVSFPFLYCYVKDARGHYQYKGLHKRKAVCSRVRIKFMLHFRLSVRDLRKWPFCISCPL